MNIALYGYFGISNWGDDGALLAMITRIRELDPTARLRCISTSRDVASTRLGIETIPSGSRNQSKFWDRELPLALRIPASCSRLLAELIEYSEVFRALRGTEVLMLPGTGVLTDSEGLHGFGPYTLFKWVLIARLRGAKVALVSVGAGPLYNASARILVRISLSLASYRSYRDVESRDLLQKISSRFAHDPVYPDLALGLSQATLPLDPQSDRFRERAPSVSGRRVVGLGLMAYQIRYSGGDPKADIYTRYLETLAAFARWLLEHDYDVRLLLGDENAAVVADFRSTFAQSGDDGAERIAYTPFTSVQDVLAAVAETDLVVATRFHNVAFALVLQKPVIAISFHHKCASLMSRMNLQNYCLDIHHLDAAQLFEQFQSLEQDQDAVKHTIADGMANARAALDEQYDAIISAFGKGRKSAHLGRVR